ncbi:MAG: vWA domain-containing protein, partial [Planctomycetota bacterium]
MRLFLGRRSRSAFPLHLFAALITSLITLSLAGPLWRNKVPRKAVAVMAIDASLSVSIGEIDRARAESEALARRLRDRGIDVEFVEFDERVTPRPEAGWDDIARGETSGSASDGIVHSSRVLPAVLYALGRMQDQGGGWLFLFSDGRFSDRPRPENLPRGVAIHTFPLEPSGTTEVTISSIEFRPPVEEGTPATAIVDVEANESGKGVVTLYRNGKKIAASPAVLTAGAPLEMTFYDLQFSKGLHRISARFEGQEGILPASAPAFVDINVEGPPQILVVDRDPPCGVSVLKALEVQGINLTASSWADRNDIEALENFDGFVLISPPSEAAHGSFTARLARAVKGGGGLVVVADETGFGPAYRDTPLAAAVPVTPPEPHVTPPPPDPEPGPEEEEEPNPPPVEEPPPPDEPDPLTERKPVEVGSVILVFLIDKSGSMAGKKIRLAKEAAIAAAMEIGEKNSIGVLAFDTEATWLVPVTAARRHDWIIDRVSRLQAGGGTNIFPALVKSLNALKEFPARIKHVILISDGYNKTLEDFQGVVANMSKAGITLSTIGVGEQFDSRLLSSLTYWAGGKKGRFDFTHDFKRIPRLVLQQTRWALGKTDAPDEEPLEPEEPPPPPDPVPSEHTPPPNEDPPDELPGEVPPNADPPKLPLRITLTHPSPPFRGISEREIPPVYGLRKAIPGPMADVLARGPSEEPIIVMGE